MCLTCVEKHTIMKKDKHTQIPSKLEAGIGLFIYVALLIFLSFGLSSCSDECEVENIYTYYEPVYTPLDEIRSSVKSISPIEIKAMGKLFYKSGFLFINEPNEGVHVIDNRDPSQPINLAFISIPGSFDLAINGNVLYSDSYIDLIAIDISDPLNAIEIGRVENVFDHYNSYGFNVDEQLGVVTDWVETNEVNVTQTACEGREYFWGINYARGIAVNESMSFDATAAVSPANPGIGGSMARFAIANNGLFALDQAEMISINIDMPHSMEVGSRLSLGWGIETIFPKDENIFIGAVDGMYIVDVKQPASPELISIYSHINSCDPVIVDGDLAYVTLRSGTSCNGFTNVLEVIDISNLEFPQLLTSYEMTNPHGLGKDGNLLFICDGDAGLRVFDASDINTIGDNQIINYSDVFAYDVIPFNNVAMMLSTDGLYQYDYSDVNNIRFLSKINFASEN